MRIGVELRTFARVTLGLSVLITVQTSQSQSPQGTLDASVASAFNGGHPVQSADLVGVAVVNTGQNGISVSMNISIKGTGESTITTSKPSGDETLHQVTGGTASPHQCTQSSSTGTTDMSSSACWLSVSWLLPQLTLQPKYRSPALRVTEPYDSACVLYCIGIELDMHSKTPQIDATIRSWSRATLKVDPNSHLPSNLSYRESPGDGSMTFAQVDVAYSDYRTVGSAQVPYRIVKSINGHPFLTIQLTSIQLQ